MTVDVRAATRADAAAIREIGLQTWPGTYAFAGQEYIKRGLATWWSEAAVLHGIEAMTTLVAVRDGEVIGMGNLDLTAETPVIWKLYVLPQAQGSGAGHALLTALVDAVPPERGCVCLEYVDGNHRARRFYERHGFVESHRTSGDGPDAVWMARPVAPSGRTGRVEGGDPPAGVTGAEPVL